MNKRFFRYCINCGKRFQPIGRYVKLCIDCQTPAHKSYIVKKLEKYKTKPKLK